MTIWRQLKAPHEILNCSRGVVTINAPVGGGQALF